MTGDLIRLTDGFIKTGELIRHDDDDDDYDDDDDNDDNDAEIVLVSSKLVRLKHS